MERKKKCVKEAIDEYDKLFKVAKLKTNKLFALMIRSIKCIMIDHIFPVITHTHSRMNF